MAVDGDLHGAVRGHHDHVDGGADGPRRAQQVLAADSGEHEIREDEVDGQLSHQLQRQLAADRGVHGEALALEDAAERVAVLHLVVHDEQGAALGQRRGRVGLGHRRSIATFAAEFSASSTERVLSASWWRC
jgi:hypothetical protein